jgi:ABC-type dipeptide/oligopeptide/nickel transport system permease subunit
LWPSAFLGTTLLSLNFIGDGLRDALDPKART